jgi:PhzF family phenazine biosynthesis protein
MDILPVDIVKEASDYRIIMTQGAVEVSSPLSGKDRDGVLRALGLSGSDLDERCPISVASTGHSKVMVGIKRRATLNALQPDLSHLTELSAGIGSNGYFVFTLDTDDPDIP